MANRLGSFVFLTLAGLSVLPLAAQQLVSVRVMTEPAGARFTVDGLEYMQPTSFSWPVGSKHVVTIVSPTISPTLPGAGCEPPTGGTIIQYDPACRTRYKFSTWEASGVPLPDASGMNQTITADTKMTLLKAIFSAEYRVDIAFFDRNGISSTQECAAKAHSLGPKPVEAGSGAVFVNGICLDGTGYIWASAGALALQSVPFDGYVFRGWTFDGTPRDAAQGSVVEVRGPMLINPRFEPAKRVRLYTSPAGLRLRVDSTEILTVNKERFVVFYPIPGYFDWAAGSKHVIAGMSPQVDLENRTWVFKDWSNGLGQNAVITLDNQTNVPLELTGNFVRGVSVSVSTEPAGLKLDIEGRDNWPSTNFVWGVGMKYSVAAPAEQTDIRGRKYLFKRWSNDGPASQQIVPETSQIVSGIRMTAVFEPVPQAVLQSSIPGMKISVDGVTCSAPCRLDRPVGTVLNIAVPNVIPISDTSRYEFTGWSDGATAERTLTITKDTDTLRANYRIANRLLMVADPGEGATLTVDPVSEDGFYPTGTNVTLTAEAKPGFRFRRWDGDLTGTFRSGTVNMSMTRLVRAMLDKVPYVAPAGVRNAAADLPDPGVAPGLIAIYGASLAKTYEAATSNPLAQSVGGTVVLVEDRLLPLIYVSPEQINAQLPGDLTPREYKLTVRTEGLPDVTSTFSVVRNAPGLFAHVIDTTSYAVALHEDGSPVTIESPARRNELISLMGTGFGPYTRTVIDGFPTPATPAAPLVDPVDVVVAGARLQPAFAGAAPGFTGMTTTRFRVGENGSGPVEVKVVVNGKESNTVILPVE